MKTKQALTPEQEEKRDARRAHFRALVEHLKKMPDTERAKFSGKPLRNPEGHVLSAANTVLANLQRPGCRVVAGWKQWKKYNRSVMKGERGITVWVPTNAPKDDQDPEPDEIRFSTTTVFDISQTTEIQEPAKSDNSGRLKVPSPVQVTLRQAQY
jgi:hypothetical protein